jgi:hypothetical protein
MCDEFLVVFPGFLETKDEDDKLLAPVRSLHEIVALEFRSHLPIWVICNSAESEMSEIVTMASLIIINIPIQKC